MSFDSEFSCTAGASGHTDLFDQVELGNLQKEKKKNWPKAAASEVSTVRSD